MRESQGEHSYSVLIIFKKTDFNKACLGVGGKMYFGGSRYFPDEMRVTFCSLIDDSSHMEQQTSREGFSHWHYAAE